MKLVINITLSVLLFLLPRCLPAQTKQTIRGIVADQLLQQPLAGATISIPATHQNTTTNQEGAFRFSSMPVGQYRLIVSYTGYKEIILDNITVNAGKETVLTVALEALVKTETEVVVKASSKKNKPLNDLSTVSARAFTVEETQRYAAAVNDPLRMAAAFPGVMANDDGNNNIVIRGNSPTGLLWRMEGIDIPSPNHFSQPGLSGGGISILSSQLLANSDFVTAAFAAEYGNALSGVFDIKLRKGNNEKKEYALQAGVLGLNAAAEGPFSKNYKGSYLVNARYSTLTILSKIGVLPNDNTTNFSDLSYNIYLPTNKAGTFTLFGFGGLSDQVFSPDKDSTQWQERSDRYQGKFISNTSMNGITHSILLNDKLKISSAAGFSATKIAYNEKYTENDGSLTPNYIDEYSNRRFTVNTTLHYKFNKQLFLRSGLTYSAIYYKFYRLSAPHTGDPLQERLNSHGNTTTQQAFAQLQFKPNNNITVNGGLHYLRLAHNKTFAIEPRFSARWNITNRSSIGMGYGLHSQLQTLNVYFAQLQLPNGSIVMPNKNLGLTRSHHYVLSYNYRLAANMQLKTELYYQQLFNVPVATHDSSTLSALNVEFDYITDPLINKGKGRNYGVEISLERYLHHNFYLMLSNSLYQSKYKAIDGIERNTRFNGNYIFTFISGKEFINNRKTKTLGVNIKTIYAGGFRTTPVDVAASQTNGYTVYKELEAFRNQNPAYFRTDVRFSIQWNRKAFTSTLSLDIQNVTNRLNVFNQQYNVVKDKVEYNYQTGLIPILNYKIEF